MRTVKGIVFEKKSNYMIFLTKEGEFLKGIPIEDEVEIGDDVLFQIITPSASMKTKRLKLYSPILAAAAIILLIFTALFQTNNQVHAYVQLEMEQSLEFGLDKNGDVITCRLLDEDMLLSKEDLAKWKGESISVVLNEVIEELSTLKQMEDIRNIQITAVYEPVEKTIAVKELINNTVQDIRNTHAELLWDVSESSMDIRKRANQSKMTIRQYNQSSDQKQPVEKIKPANQNNKDSNKIKKQNEEDENPKGNSENNRNNSPGNNDKPKQQKDDGQNDKKEKIQDSKKNSSQPNKQQNPNDSKKTDPNGKNHPHQDKHPGKGKGPEKSRSNSGN